MEIIEDDPQAVCQHYVELVEQTEAVFVKIALNHFITADCMENVVDCVCFNHNKLLECVVGARLLNRERAKSAVDTAILSAAVAVKLNFSWVHLRKTVEAALLHDVGMFCIPQDIVEKPGSLSNAEQWYIVTHPIQSYKTINRELNCSEDVAQIALQHHEFWNGEGYPKRLTGTEISLEARIIAVAGAFAAMIGERPYRRALGGHEAMKGLVSHITVRFAPDILKAFVSLIGMYPIGSVVELTDGTIVQVLEYSKDAPLLKPRVRIIADHEQKRVEQRKPVDLSGEKGLFIKRALDHYDPESLYQEPNPGIGL